MSATIKTSDTLTIHTASETALPDNMSSENSLGYTAGQEDPVGNYVDLHERKNYETLDYPVSVYYLDLRKSYMNRVRWHWHEEMEILIINNGLAEISTDDASYTLRPGQGIIINQNVLHSIHSLNEENCTFYSLAFNPVFLFGPTNNYLQTQFLLPIQNFRLFKMLVLDETNAWHERMMDAVNDVIAVNLMKPFGYEIAAKGNLCRFWSELVGQLPQVKTAPPSRVSLDEQRVKQALLYIRTHHAEPLSLDEISDSVHISKSECCRCFARTLQMSPFEYLMKYRIFEATRKMMDHPDEPMSIADLALSVGFNNTSYFNKLFKKFLGCTPTYYRTHKVLSGEAKNNGPFSIPLP